MLCIDYLFVNYVVVCCAENNAELPEMLDTVGARSIIEEAHQLAAQADIPDMYDVDDDY